MRIRDKVQKIVFGSKIGKSKHQNFWWKLYTLSLKGMNIGEASGFEESGEKRALSFLKENVISSEEPILFDVGANVGGYTLELLACMTNPQIHCFEPAAETYKTLCQNVNDNRVICNNFGISDSISKSTLYYDKENSGMASLYNRQLDYFGIDFSKSETVSLDTLDHYCEENEISYIDFLKMDIEGNELNALRGARSMLSEQKIAAIQIEFGGCNLDSRTYFRDYWNLLHTDYYVYRIVKDGLYKISQYDERLELFTCTNYMFICKNALKNDD